jgi:antitoxin VapB
MPLNIKDPATEKSVRKLAAEILEIGMRCAALPDLDQRGADEILGYDEAGLPSATGINGGENGLRRSS